MKRKLTPLITSITLGIITLILAITVNIVSNSISFPAWAFYGILIVFTIATLTAAGLQVFPQLSTIQTAKNHKKISDPSLEENSNNALALNDQGQNRKNFKLDEQDISLRPLSSLLTSSYLSNHRGIYGALATTIDAITQAPLRLEAAKLENRAKELEIALREQREKQTYQIEIQKTELENMRRQLDLEQQRLELQKQRLELEKERVEFALEVADKMISVLHPEADGEKKALLIQALLPNLLELHDNKGLELLLQFPQTGEK